MTLDLDFPPADPPLVALGRNDWFNAVGVNVAHCTRPERVTLINRNSKGWLGPNQVTLPADPNILRQIADELNRIANRVAAETAARKAGWYINSRGNFETVMGADVPDEITTFGPSDPDGGWITLCEAEGIPV